MSNLPSVLVGVRICESLPKTSSLNERARRAMLPRILLLLDEGVLLPTTPAPGEVPECELSASTSDI